MTPEIDWQKAVALTTLILTLVMTAIYVADMNQPQTTHAASVMDPEAYLVKYGYKHKTAHGASSNTRGAILQFQKMAGLAETGEMDEETLKAMRQTRCGNPYRKSKKNLRDMRPKRKRRDLSDGRWDSRELTYRIVNYPSWTEMTQEDVSMQIKKAFNVWSEAAQVDFVQKREGVANIAISFLKEHTDTLEPFDGENGTLAHAYYPDSNRTETEVHFDDDEYFTSDANGKGVDLFQLSVHEIGHSLGILHRKLNKESIMFELYRYRQSFALHSDDIQDIQDLFGKRRNNTVDPPPELCFDPAFDAITRTEDGTTYMFKGNFYWRLTNDDILKDSPGRIKADWPGLPGSLDAAATLPDGRTYFFKNDQCWIFRNRKRESGPKFISSLFPGAPDNINAAFYWNIDQHTYFFKGDGYWKFNGNKIAGTDYPRLIANAWKGVPDDLNDVFTWQDGKTYFFKDKKYYRFNVDDDEVDTRAEPRFPRTISYWWFGCDNSVSAGR